MSLQQDFHPLAQGGIVAADFVEIGRPPIRGEFQRTW